MVPTSAGDPPTQACRSGLVSYVIMAFFLWVLVHTRLLCILPHHQEWSLCFPQFCGSQAVLLPFEARLSGDLSSCYQTPRLGSQMQDSEPSLQWENFCAIIVCGAPTWQVLHLILWLHTQWPLLHFWM